jgi:hypothetical protein
LSSRINVGPVLRQAAQGLASVAGLAGDLQALVLLTAGP